MTQIRFVGSALGSALSAPRAGTPRIGLSPEGYYPRPQRRRSVCSRVVGPRVGRWCSSRSCTCRMPSPHVGSAFCSTRACAAGLRLFASRPARLRLRPGLLARRCSMAWRWGRSCATSADRDRGDRSRQRRDRGTGAPRASACAARVAASSWPQHAGTHRRDRRRRPAARLTGALDRRHARWGAPRHTAGQRATPSSPCPRMTSSDYYATVTRRTTRRTRSRAGSVRASRNCSNLFIECRSPRPMPSSIALYGRFARVGSDSGRRGPRWQDGPPASGIR